jgi:hypothetical protein
MTTNLEKEERKSESCDNRKKSTPTQQQIGKEKQMHTPTPIPFPFPTLRPSVDLIDIHSVTSLGNL